MASLFSSIYFLVLGCVGFINAFSSKEHLGRFSHNVPTVASVTGLAAMGFGKGTEQKGSKKAVPSVGISSVSLGDKKKIQLQERIIQQYGGNIAQGTQDRIQQYMNAQPSQVQEAAQLYQKISRWDAYVNSLTPQQQQSIIPLKDMVSAEKARRQLQALYSTHGFSDTDMHNLFQKFTWDASADAKAAKSITGQMPAIIQQRVNRASEIVGRSIRAIDGRKGRVLDVGCGYGVLIPSLLNSGVLAGQYVGVDLSPQMIRNAQEFYRGMNFVAADFIYGFEDNGGFDGIIFCSSLHDLPNIPAALTKANRLLRPGGCIVIVHPQGARHVQDQRNANPTMVKRSLPNDSELERMATQLSLVLECAPTEDEEDGYLAVLRKPKDE